MHRTYLISTSVLLLGIAAVGYAFTSLSLRETPQNTATSTDQIFLRRGVVEAVDPDKKFVLMRTPTRYNQDAVYRFKVYLDHMTHIEQSTILAENDIIYFEGIPVPSDISHVAAGDQVMITYVASGQRFTALYIRTGDPLPGI